MPDRAQIDRKKTRAGVIGTAILAIVGFLLPASGAAVDSPESAPIIARSDVSHQVQLLDTGAVALNKLVESIRGAQASVALEYFSFDFCSEAGQAVLQAIHRKISEGRRDGKLLQVRLILDHFGQNGYGQNLPLISMTQELRRRGIQLRFFNPTLDYDLGSKVSMNQRDHRKTLIVDGDTIVTGGRNISDDYFGLNPGFNRVDKDVWVRGPGVEAVRKAFNETWDHPLTADLTSLSNSSEKKKNEVALASENGKKIMACIQPKEENIQLLDQVKQAAEIHEKSVPSLKVESIAFGMDRPGFFLDKEKSFVPFVFDDIRKARKSVFIENQYFIPDGTAQAALDSLKNNRVPVHLVTNSFSSQDDHAVGRLTHQRAQRYRNSSVRIRGFRATDPLRSGVEWHSRSNGSRWQLHGKAAVIDGKNTWIGSNNIDPRSEYSNLEVGVLIPNDERFAGQTMDSIGANMGPAFDLLDDPQYADCYVDFERTQAAQDGLWQRAVYQIYETLFTRFY